MKYLVLFPGMEDATHRIKPNSKHFKNSGAVRYLISPQIAKGAAPLIPARKKRSLEGHFLSIRDKTMAICKPLQVEDFVPKYKEFKSIKWHLAHSTWLFERLILTPFAKRYKQSHTIFDEFFTSTEDLDAKGDFSRPSLDTIVAFREHINDQMGAFLERYRESLKPKNIEKVEYTLYFILNLEMEAQEDILSQIKARFYESEVQTDYWPNQEESCIKARSTLSPLKWNDFPGGLVHIGHNGDTFSCDMEGPRHIRYINPFSMAQRPVTNGEFLQFIEEDGYKRGGLWLSEGWDDIKKSGRCMPKYWHKKGSTIYLYTLAGITPLKLNEPVSHISFFEADAYARYAKARLPTEIEWEVASKAASTSQGNFLTEGKFHPELIRDEDLRISNKLKCMFGDVWEWTTSLFTPYPGYIPKDQSLWKYTGRLEGTKRVLKGGSCLFDGTSFRPTMRKPAAISQQVYCTGIRLAKDVI